MRIWKELRAVGIMDWCWFVLRLRRNEFHPKLSYGCGDKNMMQDRQRAHDIDLKLSGLK